MSRLTDKDCYKYEDFCFNYRNRETMKSGADFAMYAKLKSLEDLEEKIGIDLIETAKLCKQVNRNKVVYIKKDGGIDTINLLSELDIELFNHRLYANARVMYISLDLYNYGKTWALTKEELEEDFKERD